VLAFKIYDRCISVRAQNNGRSAIHNLFIRWHWHHPTYVGRPNVQTADIHIGSVLFLPSRAYGTFLKLQCDRAEFQDYVWRESSPRNGPQPIRDFETTCRESCYLHQHGFGHPIVVVAMNWNVVDGKLLVSFVTVSRTSTRTRAFSLIPTVFFSATNIQGRESTKTASHRER
jgi:hypothetical protein